MLSIKTRISNIPCIVDLISADYDRQSDSYSLDWMVCDRKGYAAKWLANKLQRLDVLRIEAEFIQCLKGHKC